jgi:RimJ/RimL family protein N-acetyltransferase
MTQHRGRIVTSYCLGTRRLCDFVHDNPLLMFLPIDHVCDPAAIAANPRVVSITQAFAVDLTGQICIDQFEGEFYGGISTQAAFMRGAARSIGGKPIICLASTTESGASRIKPLLTAGDGVGLARSDVHYVVTEYGIAYLFGKSIRERAVSLIEVAHPTHREELLAAAKRLGYVPTEQYLASQAGYPVSEERSVRLKNGKEVLLRPARAADADALRALFHRMPADDVYTRFFRRVRSLSYKELQTLCNVNHETEVAFLATTGPRESEVLAGSGCYFLNPTTNLAEVAFMVAPEWQGVGLGTALQSRLQEYALGRGVRGFTAEILPGNTPMLKLAHRATGIITSSGDKDAMHVSVLFADRSDVVTSASKPDRHSATRKAASIRK